MIEIPLAIPTCIHPPIHTDFPQTHTITPHTTHIVKRYELLPEHDGWGDIQQAQNAASCWALYQLMQEQPLEEVLVEPFGGLWCSFDDAAKTGVWGGRWCVCVCDVE